MEYLRREFDRSENGMLTVNDIFKMLGKQFAGQIIFIVFLYGVEIAARLGFSILLQELFSRVANLDQGNNLQIAYIIAFTSGVLWFLGQIGRHNGFYEVRILVSKIQT